MWGIDDGRRKMDGKQHGGVVSQTGINWVKKRVQDKLDHVPAKKENYYISIVVDNQKEWTHLIKMHGRERLD